jgi:threonine dehydratase
MRYAAGLAEIRTAARRIEGIAHRTPVATCATLDRMSGKRLFFKCENLQKTGSFKFRGAWNSVSNLTAEQAARGVVTHSSGNHAQALALAARMRGIAEEYGGVVVLCEPTLRARETTAEKVLAQTGGTFIHPYDAADTIAGQGTVGLELVDEVGDLDAIVAPVGGGGLLSGICLAASGLRPRMRLFAAEPSGADDAARSLAAGKLIPQTSPETIADGLRTSLGALTWPIIRDHVERIVTVRDEQIVQAMRLVWERAKLLIEPSAAVPVAAVLTETFRSLKGIDSVGIVLSGGNADLERLPFAPSPAWQSGAPRG